MAAAFSPQQQAFIGTYAKLTGLHPGVVAAQVAAEEPVGAPAGYHGTQDWLNIGITDSGPMGAGNPAWKDPVKAAQLSAQWVKGQTSIPGFGSASPGIRNILSTVGQSPQAQVAALQKSGWASSGYPSLPSLYNTYQGVNPAAAAAGAGGSAGSAGAGGLSASFAGPNIQFDQAAFQRAQQAAIAGKYISQSNQDLWNLGPKSSPITGPDLFAKGLLTTTMPNQADYQTTSAAQTALQHLAGTTDLTTHPGALPAGQGNVNPLAHGWTLERTDQGVDARAAPGTPILAPNDVVVKEVVPNWYAGQPLVLMQLTAGPDRGKYIYAAEQITQVPKVGQRIPRGQVVARYASSGSGIEIGWGDPRSPGRTLAQATPGYSGDQSQQALAAGSSFRKTFLGG